MVYYRKQRNSKMIEMEFVPHQEIISKKLNMIQKFTSWILWSSANSNYISLTIKGLVPFLLLLGISEADTQVLSGALNEVILAVSLLLSGFTALYGLIRKILNTVS
jgi:hypothetical protein